MLVRKMNTCSDPKNPECPNYADLDADPNPRHEVSRDYRGLHRSKFTIKKVTELYDFVGAFDGSKAYDVVMKAVMKSPKVKISLAPTRPTTDIIPDEVKAKALLSKSAYLKDAFNAQEFLDKNGLEWEVLSEYTTDFMTTAITEEGKVLVAFRGTEPTNIADVYNDIKIIKGEGRHFAKERQALNKIVEEFGKENIELTGHSLGGNKAIELGKQLGLDTETFNPLIGRDALTKRHPNTTNKIWATTDDVASPLAELGDFIVNRVRPLKSSLNPIDGHGVKNFFEVGERRPDFREKALAEAKRAGERFGELDMISDMRQEISSTFKEWLTKYSPRDITPEGNFSNRITSNSRLVKLWDMAGGNKEPELQEHLSNTPEPSKPTRFFTTAEEREKATQQTVENARQDWMDAMERANADNETHAEISETLIEAVNPVSLAKGTVASMAGAGIVEMADPEHKLPEDAHQALAGGAGGVLTEMAVAGTAVSASGALAGGAIGAGGAVAGYETQKAVEKAMRNANINEDATGSLSSMTGGAVAGATTAVGAIGVGAVAGAELGAMGGPLGVAVGTGIGTIAGLAGWGIGKLFHHDDHGPSLEEILEKQTQEQIEQILAERKQQMADAEARRKQWYDEHPHEVAEMEAERRAREEAQVIDMRPQRTFKGRPIGGMNLGTYTNMETGAIPLADTSGQESA